MKHRVWNPEEGPDIQPEQRPPSPPEALPDGTVLKKLWVPSEGPCRKDPGGAGGEPEGQSLPISKVVWD